MQRDTKKAFELLYNASQRLEKIDVDADKVFIFDKINNEYIPIGAIMPEEAKDVVKKIKSLREKELSFFITYQKPIRELVDSLSPHELKVLFFLGANCSYGNKIYNMGYDSIARDARMSKDTVSKSMRKLKESKLIHAKKEKNRYTYTINPSVFWRGSYYGIKDTMNLFADER